MRRRIIAMLSLVGALAAFTPVRAPADSLPRVFYTPAERAAITARRRAAVAPGETTASASLAAVADAVAGEFRLRDRARRPFAGIGAFVGRSAKRASGRLGKGFG